jgi:hypothetical protein
MSYKKIVVWCVLSAMAILLLAAISIPNLVRSKIAANKASRFAKFRSITEPGDTQETQSQESGEHDASPDGRKIIQTAALDLIVADVQDTAMRIQAMAENAGGYLEKSEFRRTSATEQSADLIVRVPQTKMGRLRDDIRKLARRVEADKSDAQDVTRQFVDSEARLRNLKTEEAQYLELMHRSGSIKDILDVTGHLSEVRGHIEQTQGELQYLSHQVEMASITIVLATEYSEADRRLEWHPLKQFKMAFRDMLENMTVYADAMISFALFVPVAFVWTVTVVFFLIIGWKTLRWVFIRFVRTKPSGQSAV